MNGMERSKNAKFKGNRSQPIEENLWYAAAQVSSASSLISSHFGTTTGDLSSRKKGISTGIPSLHYVERFTSDPLRDGDLSDEEAIQQKNEDF